MLKFFKGSKKEQENNKIIFVGLGNPGKQYANTRHNVGFMAIDELIKHWNATEKGSKKGSYDCFECSVSGKKVFLVKPLTFMNLSGKAVQGICAKARVPITSVVVMFDDIAIPFEKLKIRKQGSAGGHNGLKSIIAVLGQNFPRIKIGIGDERAGKDLSDHVLSKFSKEEKKELDLLIESIPNIAKSIIEDGLDVAMNKFN